MMNLHTPAGALWLLQVIASAFLAVLFLQSAIDKVIDRAGNLSWLTGHFAQSPLLGSVPLLLSVVTVLEMAAGVLSAIGCAVIVLRGGSAIAFYGAIMAAISILALFFGQRMAKEYAGAAVLASYFLLTLAAIYLLAF
jgi:hypothetical protein